MSGINNIAILATALGASLRAHMRSLGSVNWRGYIWHGTLALVFCASLLAILYSNQRFERVLYYFPHFNSGGIAAEERYIPQKDSLRERVHTYLQEYILGPQNIELRSIFRLPLRIESLYLYKPRALGRQTLVVEYSANLVSVPEDSLVHTQEALGLLERGIRHNFPRIGDLRILVQGEEL